MRWSSPLTFVAIALTTWTLSLAAVAVAQAPPPAAAKMANPVKPTPASIAAGKTLFDAQCASCHGTAGKGDGKMAAMMNPPKPSDLTDASWKHGGTDGEIFGVIHDGSKGTAMRGYASRIQTEEMWNVVNYVKTLNPQGRRPR
jgi:mono/diheme cytochrome c family protein